MKPIFSFTCMLMAITSSIAPALADGGFFYLQGESVNLAQTKQEVLIAFYKDADDNTDRATYVLRSRYSGEPEDLAWVIPLPATPIEVTALESDQLFDELNEATEPRFYIVGTSSSGGCGCGPSAGAAGDQALLVQVEASGQAGIYAWAALTSTGSDALVDWLNQNGFAVPSSADSVIAQYTQQGMHFLAVRINEPANIETNEEGEIEIPPIQFTCQTSERFYPMAISQISSANETEVLIYILSNHRAEASNIPNTVITANELFHDPNSTSLTNYESLCTQKIAELEGTALITEYAGGYYYLISSWQESPLETLRLEYLTRLRTVMSREKMTLDFEFQDASNDDSVYSDFYISRPNQTTASSMIGQPLAAILVFGIFGTFIRRQVKSSC